MKFGFVILLMRMLSVIAFMPSLRHIYIRCSLRDCVLNGKIEQQEMYPSLDDTQKVLHGEQDRRSILQQSLSSTLLSFSLFTPDFVYAADDGGNLVTLSAKLKQARVQLDSIPQLIKDQKWDSVRAVLITPPLSDCWSKTGKLLKNYASAIGTETVDGDELAALELKEEALDHLRFLDMAVYNNVFNPIRTEGESGATKELIKSYYDDPVREFNACVRVMDALIALAN